ncbi:MAG TPA: UDP-N-acetylmuramoylalanyl-D-glutamyl-2,6-diaminopimelate--D-alanyl-D-alanine ligase [Roseiarcus sp.]|nr:UDP-N-acetylmuramoylalanyl-D-glutamyl-2,6-diaminopimelate--D-alanyl-D-alanine ligase [Roseiarcus sp.]
MSEALWTPDELKETLGAPTSAPAAPIRGVSIDTRTLQAGDLFFAIKGDASDGHAYVERAFAAGAAAAVVARDKAEALADHGALFAVDDTLRAIERLGAMARRRTKARIAAVTGSVGKTSAKEMLRVVLSKVGATHAAAASYNNHWGVPLTLARMPASAAFGVFEIGMNHAGEITPLVALVRPHAALVTAIAPVHIEHLGSLEAIAEAKAEIFTGLEPGGAAILPRDAPQFDLLRRRAEAAGARIATFGAGREADARLVECRPQSRGSHVEARIFGRSIVFELGAPGLHMAQNALGVVLVAHALGVEIEASAAALADFAPAKGRGERIILHAKDGAVTLIDESYNANPASMRAALDLLGAAEPGRGGRRIAALGDMLELGPQGPAMHVALAADLARNRVDLLFCAGPLMRGLYETAPQAMRGAWAAKAVDIEKPLFDALRGGDVVMVKGSNGSRMGPVVAALKTNFSGDASAA